MIHPSILSVVEDVRTGVMNGQLRDQKSIAAATMYCQIRAIEYSKVFAKIGAGFLVLVIAGALAWSQLGRPVAIFVILVLLALWLVRSFRFYKSYDERLTWQELNSLKSALYLAPEQYAYLDCFQFIDESKAIPDDAKVEWATLFNAILDRSMSSKLSAEEAKQVILKSREALLSRSPKVLELESIKAELSKLVQ
jgi:hypothetical protein